VIVLLDSPQRVALHTTPSEDADMGAQLVAAAYAFAAKHEPPLKPNEKLLLIFMALTALDTDKSPRYFAARESSALALGRLVPDAPTSDNPRADEINAERAAAFQRVKEALAGLVKAKAIERVRSGRPGQRAEFVLKVGTDSVPLAGTDSDPSQVRIPYATGTDSVPPRNHRNHRNYREDNLTTASTSLDPVENEREKESAHAA
jgi:hypothetical protein